MKKLTLTAVTSLACLTAFAQGKIGFATDSLHLVAWEDGSAVNSDHIIPGLPGIAAYLYLGTSSSQLFLYSGTTFGTLASGPGKWSLLNVQANANPTTGAPAIPSGTVFVEVAVLSTEKAAPNIFDPGTISTFAANGVSTEFSFLLGTGVTYPVLYGPNSGGSWPAGTFPMDQYGVGSRAAIVLGPEPSAMALTGLGAAAMMILRRKRKA